MSTNSPDNGRHRIDLTNALAFIQAAGEIAVVANGQTIVGEGRVAAQSEAYLGRQLLNAADVLEMAACHIRNEYWGLKGEVSFDV